MSKASAPMRIGGKQKESTPVSKEAKASPPAGTRALKRSASDYGKGLETMGQAAKKARVRNT